MDDAARRDKGARLVMLLSDGFGGRGGIAKFNRDFLCALAAAPGVASIDALPRLASGRRDARLPARVSYDLAAARSVAAFLWRVGRRTARRPAINVVICGHINLLPPAWLMARLRGARLTLIIHGYEAWSPPSRLASRLLAPRIDALLAVSRVSAERFSAWARVSAERRFILPNAVDLDQFKPGPRDASLASRYGLSGGPVVMTLGRMAAHERSKGFDKIIDLMPQLLVRFPDLTYLVVGDGDDRPRLMDKVMALGLDGRVVFAGAIEEADKVRHYQLADVFVLPSHGEGFGIVLLEAAACGLAVIGSGLDGSREALLDGELGQLIDPDDDAALIAAISAALTQPRQRRSTNLRQYSTDAFMQRVAAWIGRIADVPAQRQGSERAQRSMS